MNIADTMLVQTPVITQLGPPGLRQKIMASDFLGLWGVIRIYFVHSTMLQEVPISTTNDLVSL